MALRGETIVVTGATGQVGLPVAVALAADNEVIAAARFSSPAARERLEAAGVRCVVADLGAGELDEVPADPSFVLNFAVAKSNDWDRDLRDNAEGVGLLMARCRGARAFLHCSTTGVYEDTGGGGPYAEDAPLGDNHRVSPFLPTYSISKIATEAAVRLSARLWDLPTTIARLNVPYGDNGGWPSIMLSLAQAGIPTEVPAAGPAIYNPIHEDDIVAMVPRMLEAADVPATIVNWGGEEVVSVQEWSAYLTELTGVEIPLVEGPSAIPSVVADLTRAHELVGRAEVGWRDGFRRMVEARHADLLSP
ncbi:MAG: NAD(P)-dependent oxidoreductase [Acidimicrobiales bacterium]